MDSPPRLDVVVGPDWRHAVILQGDTPVAVVHGNNLGEALVVAQLLSAAPALSESLRLILRRERLSRPARALAKTALDIAFGERELCSTREEAD